MKQPLIANLFYGGRVEFHASINQHSAGRAVNKVLVIITFAYILEDFKNWSNFVSSCGAFRVEMSQMERQRNLNKALHDE